VKAPSAQAAGYSGTPLPAKIGLKAGMRLYTANAPSPLGSLLAGAPAVVMQARLAPFDCALAFAVSREQLEPLFAKLEPKLATVGMIWIGWPKKASGLARDLTEDVVRRVGLALGLVDVKVCAIDATWSGLKFVRRLKDRR
jgi:hypothetical protein